MYLKKCHFQTVVSGKSDPDTFVLTRTWDGEIGLLNRNIGSKNKVLKMTDGGVEEIGKDGEFEFVENPNWSISEEQVLQLGRLGVLLEAAFGGPRDIEWAFYKVPSGIFDYIHYCMFFFFFKGNLYLLQSRPITTLNSWSEFDLTHELDYPVCSEHTILSTGNVGEVMPNAMSVLTQTTSLSCTAWASELRMRDRFDPRCPQLILRHQHRGVIDVVNVSEIYDLSTYR